MRFEECHPAETEIPQDGQAHSFRNFSEENVHKLKYRILTPCRRVKQCPYKKNHNRNSSRVQSHKQAYFGVVGFSKLPLFPLHPHDEKHIDQQKNNEEVSHCLLITPQLTATIANAHFISQLALLREILIDQALRAVGDEKMIACSLLEIESHSILIHQFIVVVEYQS